MRDYLIGFMAGAMLIIGALLVVLANFVANDEESFRRLLGKMEGL